MALTLKLTEIPLNTPAFIVGINKNYSNRTFLQELGFTEQANICVIRRAPFGDPLHVRVRESEFALLKNDAENILVEIKL